MFKKLMLLATAAIATMVLAGSSARAAVSYNDVSGSMVLPSGWQTQSLELLNEKYPLAEGPLGAADKRVGFEKDDASLLIWTYNNTGTYDYEQFKQDLPDSLKVTAETESIDSFVSDAKPGDSSDIPASQQVLSLISNDTTTTLGLAIVGKTTAIYMQYITSSERDDSYKTDAATVIATYRFVDAVAATEAQKVDLNENTTTNGNEDNDKDDDSDFPIATVAVAAGGLLLVLLLVKFVLGKRS